MIRRFLQSGSVGGPQCIAAALLLAYLLQCAWLVRMQTLRGALPDSDHALRIYQGLRQWKGGPIAGTPDSRGSAASVSSAGPAKHLRVRDGYDVDHSPLYYLVAGAPLLVAPAALPMDSVLGQLWVYAPYLFFGGMLGGSLWYVARRLYGNAGGYIALVLYCFSPAMIVNSAGAQSTGEMGAIWGAFGTVFTAIAVAHTLYAPREVVLWNWRRILLLGLSIALASGNQFSLIVLALVALAFMLWVAPVRLPAVLSIWGAACGVALVLLLAAFSFRGGLLWQWLAHASWMDLRAETLGMPFAYARSAAAVFRGSPPMMIALPVALAAYGCWKRARYFGNTSPLLVAGLMTLLTWLSPTFPGEGFRLTELVFFFVFVAGVFSDLLETRWRTVVMAWAGGVLVASSIWNVVELARLARR